MYTFRLKKQEFLYILIIHQDMSHGQEIIKPKSIKFVGVCARFSYQNICVCIIYIDHIRPGHFGYRFDSVRVFRVSGSSDKGLEDPFTT